jgi:hypothetical protein
MYGYLYETSSNITLFPNDTPPYDIFYVLYVPEVSISPLPCSLPPDTFNPQMKRGASELCSVSRIVFDRIHWKYRGEL